MEENNRCFEIPKGEFLLNYFNHKVMIKEIKKHNVFLSNEIVIDLIERAEQGQENVGDTPMLTFPKTDDFPGGSITIKKIKNIGNDTSDEELFKLTEVIISDKLQIKVGGRRKKRCYFLYKS